MKFIGKIVVVAALGVVAACSNRLETIRTMVPENGTDFEKALHMGYVDLADAEFKEYDQIDGFTFMNRAEMLSKGTMVWPEEIAARELPENKVSVLTSARSRLMKALDSGAKHTNPIEAAKAQVAFDCWMQEQEENRQPEDIAKCQADFIAAMEVLEAGKAPMPATPAASFLHNKSVFFAFDMADLDATANKTIDEAVGVMQMEKVSSVMLQAYADRAGDSAYNMKLAERRAMAVKAALIKRGVSEASIKTVVYGENNLMVPTADGVKEPGNRRVEFLFTR